MAGYIRSKPDDKGRLGGCWKTSEGVGTDFHLVRETKSKASRSSHCSREKQVKLLSVFRIWGSISRDKVRHETATKWSFICKRISTLTFIDIPFYIHPLPPSLTLSLSLSLFNPKAPFHLADYYGTVTNIIFLVSSEVRRVPITPA